MITPAETPTPRAEHPRVWDTYRCGECCNGDRCDDPTHYDRNSKPGCPYCFNTGNAIWKFNALLNELTAIRAIYEATQSKLRALLEAHNNLRADYIKARNECDGLREDAERYRWLKRYAQTNGWTDELISREIIRDAAIDAAKDQK